MRGRREDRQYHVEVSADELHLLVLLADTHCLTCFPERLWRRMDELSKALARLERAGKVEE